MMTSPMTSFAAIKFAAIKFTIAVAMVAVSQVSLADSAIPLLSGFDRERIDAAYPPGDETSLSELAKLAYRLRSLDPDSLAKLARADGEPAIGDVIPVEGAIERINMIAVPSSLVEYLEFSRLHVLEIRSEQRTTRVVVSSLPSDAAVGDRVSAVGVIVDVSADVADEAAPLVTIVANRLKWFPKRAGNLGQKLLSESGVDLGLLANVASRSRRPLLAEDGDAFYSVLAAANAVGNRPDLPAPVDVDPVALLQNAQELAGEWVHMDLDCVQITRIAVPENSRQKQLGSDHYYQIDAFGDLGDVAIKIESPDKGVPPTTFYSRYPVSLVIRDLPTWLDDRVRNQTGGEAIVAPVRLRMGMDGFFYRLWSYESDFMSQQDGGQQFGPLMIPTRLTSLDPDSDDPVGTGVIGTVASIAILAAIAMIWWWQRRVTKGDHAARRRRHSAESENLRFP